MKTKEPSSATLLAARIARAYSSLSAYSSATLAEQLCAIERMQRRHAERCCSGEDGGYTKLHTGATTISAVHGIRRNGTFVHDPEAEERADSKVILAVDAWKRRLVELLDVQRNEAHTVWNAVSVEREGDPRGAVLLVRMPGETEASGV